MSMTSPSTKSTPTANSLGVSSSPARNKRRSGRRMILQFFILSVVFAVLVGGLTYVLDPLQYYRKSTWYSPVFTSEQRYQNPGLVRNYSYDTIILGTSMTENFLPSVVGEALGGQAIKLSMRGSTADEQYKIASLALETGKVKKVLWGLDYFALKDLMREQMLFFLHICMTINGGMTIRIGSVTRLMRILPRAC